MTNLLSIDYDFWAEPIEFQDWSYKETMFWIDHIWAIRASSYFAMDKDPRKKNAQLQVQNAVRAGTLTKRACERCGNEKSEGHHEDYLKALDVIWLCSLCHCHKHNKLMDIK